ncbi:M4 family metallopeptidase [Halobacillus massiliensis]|uniref:M4 family metallopeptidase n=1 Tax=Halobacillus massiliensis TaxID=1926286 RepID=UPI0009E1C579|nr:M4 family metallopeptidase [Halobacillus massiliensis]
MKKKIFSSAAALAIALGGLSTVHADENQIKINDKYNTPSYIIEKWEMPPKLTLSKKKVTEEEIALSYLEYQKDKLKLKGNMKNHFKVVDTQKDKETGTSHLRLVEHQNGVPIYGSEQTISITDNQEVTAFFGEVVPQEHKENLDTSPSIDAAQAESKVNQAIEDKIGEVKAYDADPKAELYLFDKEGDFHLTYLVKASTSNPAPGYWHYFVDASNGEIIESFNAIDNVTAFGEGVLGDKKKFEVTKDNNSYYLYDGTRGDGIHTFNALNLDPNLFNLLSQIFGYHGDEITSNHKFFSDPAAVDAQAHAADVYDYYEETFNRDSFDDEGARLISSVHVGDGWNNAAWNGVQMMYGDGDGDTFIPFSGALDVIGHELTHAVTDRSADLVYQYEPGALNESFSDILGAMVDRDDWLMGEDIYTPDIEGDALRSLEDPASIPNPLNPEEGYPDHYSKLYTGELDNGGVHVNSSINNKAAHLLSEGGTHYDVEVEGIGRKATEQIYYRALTKYLTPTSDFSMMRQAAIQSAIDIYGENSQQTISVKQAYDAVGVK